MNKKATFGPAGNSLSFAAAGGKSTLQAPAFVASLGLDRYEYQGGNGIRGSEEGFRKLGEAARANGIALSVHAPYYISLSGVDPEKASAQSRIYPSNRALMLLLQWVRI